METLTALLLRQSSAFLVSIGEESIMVIEGRAKSQLVWRIPPDHCKDKTKQNKEYKPQTETNIYNSQRTKFDTMYIIITNEVNKKTFIIYNQSAVIVKYRLFP